MLTHPVQRTRALYAWEYYDIMTRRGNPDIHSRVALEGMVGRAWKHYRCERLRPIAIIDKAAVCPHADGYKRVVITPDNARTSTALHEIAHVRGFGTEQNPHSVGFVHAYIDMLGWWFRWDREQLYMSARLLGLL